MGRVVIAVLVGTSMLMSGCLFDRSAGDTLAVVHGLGSGTSPSFDLPEGGVQFDEKGQPAGCVESVRILDSSGQAVATLTRPGPAPDPKAGGAEDPDWRAAVQYEAVPGTFHAEVKADKKCAWAVRASIPAD